MRARLPIIEKLGPIPPLETVIGPILNEPGAILLRAPGQDAAVPEWTIVGIKPELVVAPDRGHGNIWNTLEKLLAEHRMDYELPFPCGFIGGFISYEAGCELIPNTRSGNPLPVKSPLFWLGLYRTLIVQHISTRSTYIVSVKDPTGFRLVKKHVTSLVCRHDVHSDMLPPSHPASLTSLDRRYGSSRQVIAPLVSEHIYKESVESILELIAKGEFYQVNLCYPWAASVQTDPWRFFTMLLKLTHAPWPFYLYTPEFAVLSCSPEVFLSINGSHITTLPMKGTRQRRSDDQEDGLAVSELVNSEKERAELIMITDLMRNDLGQICRVGTVRVPELRRIEQHPYVYQATSRVTGELKPEISHVLALMHCFPPGSVTGAPKSRAMYWIGRIEPYQRGPYTGALGFWGLNGRSHWTVGIRTVIWTPQLLCYGTGAGIVADSDPQHEFEETIIKAKPFFMVLNRIVGSVSLA